MEALLFPKYFKIWNMELNFNNYFQSNKNDCDES